MYFRFHRSMKLLPGVRLNLSKSGPSVSLGVRGARFNVGAQGTRTTVGLPGTGLSVIGRKSWAALMGDQGSEPMKSEPVMIERELEPFQRPAVKELAEKLTTDVLKATNLKEIKEGLAIYDDAYRENRTDWSEEQYIAGRQKYLDALKFRKENPLAPYGKMPSLDEFRDDVLATLPPDMRTKFTPVVQPVAPRKYTSGQRFMAQIVGWGGCFVSLVVGAPFLLAGIIPGVIIMIAGGTLSMYLANKIYPI